MKTKAKRAGRTVRVLRRLGPGGQGGQIEIRDKTAQRYWVDAIPCEIGGIGFAVEKEGNGLDLNEVYHVRIANEQDYSCDCRGFVAHGHCKHTAALLAVLKSGKLQ